MTPTSDERRVVAKRLRELPTDMQQEMREWEDGGLFIEESLSDEADYSQIHNAVLGCFPAEHMHPCDYEELHERLADLIDPTCEVMEVPDNDEFMVRVVSGFVCKRCGHEAIVERNCDGSADPPRFCPRCGARVTSGGETGND